MQYEVHFGDAVPRIAIFASKLRHCLEDLLLRHQAVEFQAEIAMVWDEKRLVDVWATD